MDEAKSKIPEPKEGGKKINISASKITSMKSIFEKELKKGQDLSNNLPGLAASIQAAEVSNDRDLSYVARLAFSVTMVYSDILIKKANMCIQLVNNLVSHGQSSIPQKKNA